MFNTYHSLTLLVLLKRKKKKKELLEKATIIKRFEYSPLGSAFKNQTDIAAKQNQCFIRVCVLKGRTEMCMCY